MKINCFRNLLWTLLIFVLTLNTAHPACDVYYYPVKKTNAKKLHWGNLKNLKKEYDVVYKYRSNVKSSRELVDVGRKLDFTIRKGNTEIAILAERVFSKKSIDSDITNLLKKRTLALSPNPEEVVIVGGGPLGMIAGIKAWKLGKNVKIIERRVSYTREQIMGLDPNFQAWFKKDAPELYKEMHALGIFNRKAGWETIKRVKTDIEHFDSVRIQQLENSLALYIKRLEEISQDGSFKIMRNQTLVSKYEKDSKLFLQLEDNKGKMSEIPASFVIGADGAGGNSKFIFDRKTYTNSTTHYAGTGIFKANAEDTLDFLNVFANRDLRQLLDKNPAKAKILERLKKLGWEKETLPAVRVFQNGETFYIGAEIPQTLEHANTLIRDPKKRLEWFTALRDLVFPKSAVGKLRPLTRPTTAFPVESNRLDQFHSFYEKSGSYYFAVGDNAITPHFMTRSGINHGFQQIQELEKDILAKSISEISADDLANFNIAMKKNADKLFHKPVSDEFFTDGPFMRNLTSEEIKIRDFLLKSGATRISFATHIKPLQDLGISSKNTTKLKKLARALQDNPFMNESAVISLFTK